MNINEYETIKNFNYTEYCNYLINKYGTVQGDYYDTNFIRNQEIVRVNEGLFLHHIKEDTIASLSSREIAQVAPFEMQKKENLVYCDWLEHLLLHILIAEQPNNIKGLGFGGADTMSILLNSYYEKDGVKRDWERPCFDRVAEDYEVFAALDERLENIERKQSILFEHNETAFLLLENFLETDNKAVVIIGTGGGKTTTALAYLRVHNYKALVLCPNNIIKDGWAIYNEVEAMTVQTFRNRYNTIDYSKYQAIVIDEAHHYSSKNVSGKALLEVMANQPQLKFIGLTAEEKRNDGIKVADDLYNGNVCEGLSVQEGLEKGIFHPFSYVGAIYNASKEDLLAQYNTEDINDKLLGELDLALNNTPTLREILTKNMPEGKRKGIIFVSNIAAFDEAEDIMRQIYPNVEYRRIHSKMSAEEINENREWFKTTEEGYLMAVDMITEGAHYRGVNTLIMFRHTESPLVFHQQLGRVITLAKYENPHAIIYDLVNNINTLNQEQKVKTKAFISGLKQLAKQQKERQVKKSDQIIVEDYAEDIRDILEKISDSLSDDWSEEEIRILKEFYPKGGSRSCYYKLNKNRSMKAIAHKANRIGLINLWYTHLGKPVKCLETNKIYRTATEAEQETGASLSVIGLCCQGKALTAGNYHWQFLDSTKTIEEIEQTRDQSKKKAIICLETGVQYGSAQEAYKELGISYKNISSCCLNQRRIAGGYHWQFTKNYDISMTLDTLIKTIDQQYEINYHIPVYQYSGTDGHFLTKYTSITEAANTINTSASHISQCCSGKRISAGNYFWSTEQVDNYSQLQNFIPLTRYESVHCIELKQNFSSCNDAAKQLDLNSKAIKYCCDGKQVTTGGYHFCYLKDLSHYKIPIKIQYNAKTVYQYDKTTGTLLNEYPSTADAGVAIGKPRKNTIQAVCTGKTKSAYGYYWSYIKAENYFDINKQEESK